MMLEPERAAEIAANLAYVRQRIAAAALRSGRQPADVRLVAVSKGYPLTDILAARAAQQHDFGENRLEEWGLKVEAAQAAHFDDLRWHMIGTIQSRKTREVVGPFALIHSVDRSKIAQRLSRDAEAAGCVLEVLLEVNTSGEASKHGFTPAAALAEAGDLLALPGIRVCGLMTMAPYESAAEATRPVFRSLRTLRDELRTRFPQGGWNELSMGMTNDFEVAIEEGATLVRIGSAIFGPRNR